MNFPIKTIFDYPNQYFLKIMVQEDYLITSKINIDALLIPHL